MRHQFFVTLLLCFAIPGLALAQDAGNVNDANTAAGTTAGAGTSGTPTASASSDVSSLAVNTPLSNGIYNCNKVGAEGVGATAATGGTYVPVADATVELNTGYLVYKECLLRPLVDSQRKNVTLAYLNNNLELFSKGRNGNPLWVVNYGNEQAKVGDQAFVSAFQSSLLSNLNSAFQNQVKTALVRNYQMTTQAPQNSLACPYQGDWKAVSTNPQQNFSYAALFAMGNPNCDPIYAYAAAQTQMNANVAAAQNAWLNQLNWNQGIYSKTDGNGNVTTPGIFLSAIGQQSITSGFRQLENSNDIGQMVGNLFAGLGSKLLSSSGGVPSVLASNGSDAYLSQAMQQEQSGLVGQTAAIALQNLYQMLTWEQQYNDLLAQTASALTTSINQLRGSENACWALIIPKVCTDTPSGTSCTGASGSKLTIATSTQFSDAAIAKAGISGAANALKASVDASNQNIVVLNSLIAAVQSADNATRNLALSNLDKIVNANPPVLHTQSSITQAQQDLANVQAQMQGAAGADAGFVKKTQQLWAGDGVDSFGAAVPGAVAWDGTIDPGTGWCNINKQATLDQWITKWTP